MDKILNNKIYRIIMAILVAFSMYFLPSIISAILKEIGIQSESICHILALSLYLALLIALYYKELKPEFSIFKKNFNNSLDNGFKYWLIGLMIMLVSNIIINYLIMGGKIAANEEMNRQALLENPVWYTLISTVLIAPFIEELIFRKSVDKIFKNDIIYYAVSGLLFGFAHVVADLSSALNLLYIIPYGALGVSFAIMDKKTNTTFTSIMIHAFHNFITLMLLFLVLR